MRVLIFVTACLALSGCVVVAGDGENDRRDTARVQAVAPAAPAPLKRYRGADWPEDAAPPYSAMVGRGDVIHLAGIIGVDRDTGELPDGIAAQTANIFAAMARNLETAGADLGDLIACTCYLADIGDYSDFNAAYRAALPEGEMPARTTVGVAGLPIGAALEISCVAARP